MGKVLEKLNGKKIPIAVFVMIIVTIIGAAVAYGELKGKVSDNCEEIDKLKPLIEQTAVIQANTQHLKEDLIDFRTEQRIFNRELNSKLDRVLQAVTE